MTKVTNIKSWAEADRPREKMLLKGRENLSDAELIAIILGSGSRNESAVTLAKRILATVQYSLYELGRLELVDLMQFKGVGEAKAISIVAALELGRRRGLTDSIVKKKISSSKEAYDIMKPIMEDLLHEEMWAIFLNRANRVIKKKRMSSGGAISTVVDVKMILKSALDCQAQGFILVHNHPSGNLLPSQSDIHITNKMKNAVKYFDLTLADHLIISDQGYYSFADSGLL